MTAAQVPLFTPGAYGREELATPYPWHPGAYPVDTAQEAAKEIAPEVETLRALALAAIQAASPGGLTADEVAAQLHRSVLTIRPRVAELVKLGRIEDTGTRRRNASGKSARVWRVTC